MGEQSLCDKFSLICAGSGFFTAEKQAPEEEKASINNWLVSQAIGKITYSMWLSSSAFIATCMWTRN